MYVILVLHYREQSSRLSQNDSLKSWYKLTVHSDGQGRGQAQSQRGKMEIYVRVGHARDFRKVCALQVGGLVVED